MRVRTSKQIFIICKFCIGATRVKIALVIIVGEIAVEGIFMMILVLIVVSAIEEMILRMANVESFIIISIGELAVVVLCSIILTMDGMVTALNIRLGRKLNV